MSNSKTMLTSENLKLEVYTACELCELVDTPRSLAVYLLLQNNEFQQYVDLSIDPLDYQDPHRFGDDLLITRILSKSPNLPLGIDRQALALLAFNASEERCRQLNDYFTSVKQTDLPVWFYSYRQEVHKIVGSLKRGSLDHISHSMRHGPGATTAVRGVGSIPSQKYDRDIHLTANLLPFYRAITGDNWANAQSSPEIVRGSRFTTVPKTAKIDRGICVEPTLNVYVQLGIGAHLRHRLKLFGIDLDFQAVENRRLASMAESRELATIDLAAASDSISWKLVQTIFPNDWEHLLGLARSPTVKVDGEVRYLEKVSSMGNGFTFELETLLFYALCRVFVPEDEWHNVSVFGDDIILPQAYTCDLIDALEFLGFSVNHTKSFLAGRFFESCGADFMHGLPVRPFYLKGSKGDIPYVVQIANKLRLYSRSRMCALGCDPRFRPLWLKLLRKVPRQWRGCRVPDQLGDLGVITSRDEATSCVKAEDGHEGWYVKTMACSSEKARTRSFGLLLYILARRGLSEAATLGKLPKRGFLGRPRPRRTSITSWCSSLMWLD